MRSFLKIPQKLLNRHLCLAKNALKNRLREVKPVMARDRDPQMRLVRVAQLSMASGLMMDLKSGFQQGV